MHFIACLNSISLLLLWINVVDSLFHLAYTVLGLCGLWQKLLPVQCVLCFMMLCDLSNLFITDTGLSTHLAHFCLLSKEN